MIDYKNSSVLVTGGAGFIGSHLTEEFVRRGSSVTVIDNFSTGYRQNLAAVAERVDLREINLVQNDLRPLLKERNFDLIVHTVANANVPASVENPKMDFEKNAVATFNLLEAVRECIPQARILHTSSAAIYGQGSETPTREDFTTVPVSPYGVSKLASENYASIYAMLYGLRTATLRLFPVFGERLRKQVVYDLMSKIHHNSEELFIQGDGKQVRDFNHVANVVEAYFTIAENGELRGEAYNIASDETVTIHQLAEMICERMRVDPRFVFGGEARAGDMRRLHADISRLKNLGYQPRVSFIDGLDATVAWFQEEMKTMSAAV